MGPTGVPRRVRLGQPWVSMVCWKSVRNHPPAMQLSHAFSRFSVCSWDFWPCIAWTRTCTPWVLDAVRAHADAVRALEQPTASLADRYGANTGLVEPTRMGVFWTTHDSLRAQNRRKSISESCRCSSFSHGLYGTVRVKKSSKNCTNPQRSHAPSLIRDFAMRLIGKQGHKASSYEQRSLIKLSWAHMPSRFCHAQVHISVVTYFHNNSLIAWVETNKIKTSRFEAMRNEKWK